MKHLSILLIGTLLSASVGCGATLYDAAETVVDVSGKAVHESYKFYSKDYERAASEALEAVNTIVEFDAAMKLHNELGSIFAIATATHEQLVLALDIWDRTGDAENFIEVASCLVEVLALVRDSLNKLGITAADGLFDKVFSLASKFIEGKSCHG